MAGSVARFNRTERWVHAVQAVTFLLLLFTGLAISLSQLEALIGHRALLREIHLATAFFFVFGPALVALAGNRISIGEDIHDVDTWNRDDIAWLRHPTVWPDASTPPVGRYNAGQKLNAVFTVYCTVAFGVSGLIMWQNRRFPFALVSQANTVHQVLAYLALVVFAGHLYLSVIHPATRESLRGIVVGVVNSNWARTHHPDWSPGLPESPVRLSEIVRSLVLIALGSEGVALFCRWGFEWLGANVTDPVTKALYAYSALPATLAHPSTGAHVFDFGAVFWFGVAVALWYGAMHGGYTLLPRIISSPVLPSHGRSPEPPA